MTALPEKIFSKKKTAQDYSQPRHWCRESAAMAGPKKNKSEIKRLLNCFNHHISWHHNFNLNILFLSSLLIHPAIHRIKNHLNHLDQTFSQKKGLIKRIRFWGTNSEPLDKSLGRKADPARGKDLR